MEEENLKDLGEAPAMSLREACDVSRHTMAEELGVDIDTYRGWEETGEDIPISAIYHMACKFNVDLTEILTRHRAEAGYLPLSASRRDRGGRAFPVSLRGHGQPLRLQDHAAAAGHLGSDRVTSRAGSCHDGQEFNTCWKGRSFSPSGIATSS